MNAEKTAESGVNAVRQILRDHVSHLGAGSNLWHGECLSVNCSWTGQGRGTMLHAIGSHQQHLAEVIVDAINPPAAGSADD